MQTQTLGKRLEVLEERGFTVTAQRVGDRIRFFPTRIAGMAKICVHEHWDPASAHDCAERTAGIKQDL